MLEDQRSILKAWRPGSQNLSSVPCAVVYARQLVCSVNKTQPFPKNLTMHVSKLVKTSVNFQSQGCSLLLSLSISSLFSSLSVPVPPFCSLFILFFFSCYLFLSVSFFFWGMGEGMHAGTHTPTPPGPRHEALPSAPCPEVSGHDSAVLAVSFNSG